MTEGPMLEVRGLTKHFFGQSGLFGRETETVRAVDGVSFEIGGRETLALVGESGCGKTTTGRSVLRLSEPTAGEVWYRPADGRNPVDLCSLKPREMRAYRRELQIVFQDPLASLNPRLTTGAVLREVFEVHGVRNRGEQSDRVAELLVQVGLDPDLDGRFPYELSGGQRQRLGIARALAVEPRLIVCDEPVSALDVSVQAQILNLLADLQDELELSYLFISHDLSVVSHLAHRVAVMYLGRIVEIGPVNEVFENPRHPYTQALFSAIPTVDPSRPAEPVLLGGEVPSPRQPPGGCHFHPRCPIAEQACRSIDPDLIERGAGHSVACHLAP